MISADDSVLVLIDMQNGFVSPRSAHVVPRIAKFTQEWAAAGRPYVMTRFINYPQSLFEQLIRWSAMMPGTPETEIVDELADMVPGAVAVLDKPTYSLFNDDGTELVTRNGWKHVVVVGLDTESCVLKTAVDAFELGLVPWVVEDLVYSHAGQVEHEAGLLVTGRFIGRGQLIQARDILPAGATAASA
ncbi:cysteine hydrolase [Kribbella sp. NBC_01484]|uniref:isochorismatase family cysteine hydrolase n=1 Tax=Kribbella sp. NBC_01484 TaxID=2903579 RepID=UPI002E37F436|nr:isochorismatase family cysteine hydrolase [Kribbella sp. NBC_01484]